VNNEMCMSGCDQVIQTERGRKREREKELSKEWHMLRLQCIWVQKAAFNKYRNRQMLESVEMHVRLTTLQRALKENLMQNPYVSYSKLKLAYFGATIVDPTDSNNALTSDSQRK